MSADDLPAGEATPPSAQRTTGGRLRWRPPTVEKLQELLPNYEILGILGAGGMGAVYKARQRSLDRLVAIKILPLDADDDDGSFAQRFINEGRTMARMSHPGIVGVFDFGETSEGQLFIVMEFVDGTDVAQMIRSQGKLPPEYALAITAHVCDALAYAHGHGIIHRDIKPANILINMQGQVKVADFGLAKASDAGQGGLTKTNMAMGTPDFVAPEALMGAAIDGRADLYAVGVMLYNMLTGEIPRGLFMMPSIRSGGQTDPRFDKIIAKSMEMDREMRYQTAFDVRRDLDVIMSTPHLQAGGTASAAIPQVQRKPPAHDPPGHQHHEDPAGLATTPKKSILGPILGIGATIIIAIGLFFFFKPPAPPSAGPADTATSSVPPVTPTPAAPQPAPPTPPSAITAGTAPKPTPAPQADLPPGVALQTIDLLALTDPVQDRITTTYSLKNEWLRQGTALVFQSDGKGGKLAAPVAFSCRDYEIELRAEQLSGSDRIHADIPVGKNRILPLVLNFPGRKVINEKEGNSWPATLAKTVHVTIRVRRSQDGLADRIVIKRKDTGDLLADWTGSMERIARSGESHPVFPDQPVASIFVMKDPYAVHLWTLRVFAGEAKILREAPPPEMLAAKADPAPMIPATPAVPAVPVPVPVPVPDDPVSQRLAELEKQFLVVYERDAGAAFKASVASLNTSYTAALDRALVTATKAGHLDDAIAIRDEKQRISSGQGLPPADLENTSATIKSMRATYRQTVGKYEAERDKKAVPLYQFYDQALARYQTELTQQQKIDDALRVKTKREEIASKRPDAPPPPPVASTLSARPGRLPAIGAPKAADNAIPAGRSRWYDAAQWVLAVGGQVTVEKGGQQFRPTKVTELPAGKFEVTEVTIGNNPQSPEVKDEDFNRLSGLKLRYLRLTSLKITDAALAFAATTPDLESIVLVDLPITDAVLTHLAPLKKLTEMQIQAGTQFTGADLQRLACLPVLKTAWFTSGGFNDAGARALAEARNLEMLRLDNTSVTDEGIAILKSLAKLRDLSLGNCSKVRGTGLLAWENVAALNSLNLSGCPLSAEAMPAIGKFVNLSYLGLEGATVVTDDSLKSLAPLAKLNTLALARTRIFGTGFTAMAGCSELRSLYLHDVPLSVEGMSAIATSFPQLDDLRLGRTPLNATESQAFTTLKALKNFEAAFSDEALVEIARIGSLETIQFPTSTVTGNGLLALKPLKFLSRLIFDQSPGLNDTSIHAFKELKGLKELHLNGTAITAEGIASIKKALPRCNVARAN